MSCPMCGKPRVDRYRPFCSRKCADLDLARWLNGAYRFESTREDEDDDELLSPRSTEEYGSKDPTH